MDLLLEDWGNQIIPEVPPYPSQIGDDHSPYEYSVAFGRGRFELRLLVEAQSVDRDLVSNHAAALNLTERLRLRFPKQVDLSRFNLIHEQFSPSVDTKDFSLWHAATFRVGAEPELKVYLNPRARGESEATNVLEGTLDRLHLRGAVTWLRAMQFRSGLTCKPSYFSLDLGFHSDARVKVYFSHPSASALELESAFDGVPTHRRGDVKDFCDSIAGCEGPYDRKPVSTCFAFTKAAVHPTAATLHFPIAHYATDDSEASTRTAAFMRKHDLPADLYEEALVSMAQRPLGTLAGTQSYSSFRREPNGIRLTAYLSPELFRAPQNQSRRTIG